MDDPEDGTDECVVCVCVPVITHCPTEEQDGTAAVELLTNEQHQSVSQLSLSMALDWMLCSCHGDVYQGIGSPSQLTSIPLSLSLSDDITVSMPCTLS